MNTSGINSILVQMPSFADEEHENPLAVWSRWAASRKIARQTHACDEKVLDGLMISMIRAKVKQDSEADKWLTEYVDKHEEFVWTEFEKSFKGYFASAKRIRGWQSKIEQRSQKADESPKDFARELLKLGAMALYKKTVSVSSSVSKAANRDRGGLSNNTLSYYTYTGPNLVYFKRSVYFKAARSKCT